MVDIGGCDRTKYQLNCKCLSMQQNNNSTLHSSAKYPATTSTPPANVHEFLYHWAWEFYVYTFATLFGAFALSCFVALVRQFSQPTHNRNMHGRFTTVQLLIAATLKVVGLLWNPILLHDVSLGTFTASLLIDCFSIALNLSAFSILLLILLETTKTSLAAPRLQNIWVLLAITAILTAVTLTFNLLVLYADRKFWYFISYIVLLIWGILICVWYSLVGYRMWQNLKSSRRLRNSTAKGRLKNIIALVCLSPVITAVSLIMSLCLAASDYGILMELEINKKTMWSRYVFIFLLRICEFFIVVIIFGIVI